MDTLIGKQVGNHACGAASAKGCSELNQDRFRITPDGILLLDGMGGRAAGEVYAELGAWKAEQLLGKGSFYDLPDRLVDTADENGGPDNITALLLGVEPLEVRHG